MQLLGLPRRLLRLRLLRQPMEMLQPRRQPAVLQGQRASNASEWTLPVSGLGELRASGLQDEKKDAAPAAASTSSAPAAASANGNAAAAPAASSAAGPESLECIRMDTTFLRSG